MRRSWYDWLADLVDAAPAPRWVVYAVFLTLWSLLAGAVGWAAGGREFPDTALSPIMGVIFAVALLWSTQTLNGVAVQALKAVNPALGLDAPAFESTARDLQRTPAGWALLAIPFAIFAGIVGVLSNPESWELRPGDPVSGWVLTILVSSVAIACAFGFAIHAINQMRLVEDVHRRLASVDLFRLEPLYAFAKLTSLTGVALIAIVVGGSAVVSLILPNFTLSTTDLVTFGFFIAIAIAVFVVPLRGLHDRIEDEKDRRLAVAQAVLAAAIGEMQRRVTAGDIDGAARLNDAIAAANLGVEVVSRVPTWPWRPETFRGFLSAVFLPILLWLVITILGRLLPA